MDKIFNWLKSGKHRVATTFGLIFILAIISQCAGAATLKYKSGGGWMFDYQGTELFCRTEGNGGVTCIDVSSNQYVCDYRDPPIYFENCKREE